MNKFLVKGLTVISALALTAGAVACGTPAKNESAESAQAKAVQLYGFSAASAGAVISSMTATNVPTAKTMALSASVLAQPQQQIDFNELDNYMLLVDQLLNNDSYDFKAQESDRAEYAIKTVIGFTDADGKQSEYTMYYNESNVQTETENNKEDEETEDEKEVAALNEKAETDAPETPEEKPNEKPEENPTETETETSADINGVLVIDDIDYSFTGKTESETETEGNETESEQNTEFTVTLSETKTMTVEKETELETENGQSEYETEYIYTIYENDKIIEKNSIKTEQEGTEKEVEFLLMKDGNTQQFFFEQEQEEIKLHVGAKNSSKVYLVHANKDEATGKITYVYEPIDNASEEKNKDENKEQSDNSKNTEESDN